MKDQKTIDAVVRNLEIIGEAATNMPDHIQKQFSDVPWYKMKGMRNILIHEYFGVDLYLVWEIIRRDIPIFKTHISNLLYELQK